MYLQFKNLIVFINYKIFFGDHYYSFAEAEVVDFVFYFDRLASLLIER